MYVYGTNHTMRCPTCDTEWDKQAGETCWLCLEPGSYGADLTTRSAMNRYNYQHPEGPVEPDRTFGYLHAQGV